MRLASPSIAGLSPTRTVYLILAHGRGIKLVGISGHPEDQEDPEHIILKTLSRRGIYQFHQLTGKYIICGGDGVIFRNKFNLILEKSFGMTEEQAGMVWEGLRDKEGDFLQSNKEDIINAFIEKIANEAAVGYFWGFRYHRSGEHWHRAVMPEDGTRPAFSCTFTNRQSAIKFAHILDIETREVQSNADSTNTVIVSSFKLNQKMEKDFAISWEEAESIVAAAKWDEVLNGTSPLVPPAPHIQPSMPHQYQSIPATNNNIDIIIAAINNAIAQTQYSNAVTVEYVSTSYYPQTNNIMEIMILIKGATQQCREVANLFDGIKRPHTDGLILHIHVRELKPLLATTYGKDARDARALFPSQNM